MEWTPSSSVVLDLNTVWPSQRSRVPWHFFSIRSNQTISASSEAVEGHHIFCWCWRSSLHRGTLPLQSFSFVQCFVMVLWRLRSACSWNGVSPVSVSHTWRPEPCAAQHSCRLSASLPAVMTVLLLSKACSFETYSQANKFRSPCFSFFSLT